MFERDEARNRIRKRRNDGHISYVNGHQVNNFSWLHSIVVLIVIGVLVIRVLGVEMIFGYITKYTENINQIIPWSKLIPFESWSGLSQDSAVSSNAGYYQTETIGYYKKDSNSAVSLGSGLVVYIGENNNSYFVVISHDNGVSVTYGNLDVCHVHLYDRVTKGSQIGVFADLIKLEAMKDNEDLDFEEVFILFED